MATPAKGEASAANAEPLREFDAETKSRMEAEFAVSIEPDGSEHTARDEAAACDANAFAFLSNAARDAFALAFLVVCVMAIVGMTVFSLRLRVANRWASLMETSGFVDWTGIARTLKTLIITASFPVALGGLAVLIVWLRWGQGFKLHELRLLHHLVFVAVLASAVGSMAFVFGSRAARRIDPVTMKALAKQSAAVVNFNRGYCFAWCRQKDIGLAPFMRGECGPDTTTVFDGIVEMFNVGDWCKQAIATQNFDLVAAHDGLSPFACLKGNGGLPLLRILWADLLTISNGVMGAYLFMQWCELRKELPRTSDTVKAPSHKR